MSSPEHIGRDAVECVEQKIPNHRTLLDLSAQSKSPCIRETTCSRMSAAVLTITKKRFHNLNPVGTVRRHSSRRSLKARHAVINAVVGWTDPTDKAPSAS